MKWSRRTTAKVALALGDFGIQVSPNTVARLLRQMGYARRVNHKAVATDVSPDRDAQFLYISDLRQRFQRRGLPILSIDTNYDPSRIMDIARGPIRVYAVVIERQPHVLIPSVYS